MRTAKKIKNRIKISPLVLCLYLSNVFFFFYARTLFENCKDFLFFTPHERLRFLRLFRIELSLGFFFFFFIFRRVNQNVSTRPFTVHNNLIFTAIQLPKAVPGTPPLYAYTFENCTVFTPHTSHRGFRPRHPSKIGRRMSGRRCRRPTSAIIQYNTLVTNTLHDSYIRPTSKKYFIIS